jgi:transmembrane sensor
MTETRVGPRVSDRLSREGVAWVDRLKSGRMTLAEGEELQRWYRQSPEHRAAFAEAVALLQIVKEAGGGLADLGTAARLRASLPARRSGPVTRRALLGGAIAASAGAAAYLTVRPPLGLWPSLQDLAADLESDYKTGTGEQRRLSLGAVAIQMNTQTGLAQLAAKSATGIRLIHGEVALDTQGVPIVVEAGAARITSAHASLDVRIEGGEVCVTCVSGEVRIDHPRGSLVATSAEQVTYSDRDGAKVAATDLAAVTAWQQGMLIFHDEPVSRVIAEVNRYRKGRIVVLNETLARRSIYITLHLDEIDAVIDQLQHFSGAHVLRLGQIVVLS